MKDWRSSVSQTRWTWRCALDLFFKICFPLVVICRKCSLTGARDSVHSFSLFFPPCLPVDSVSIIFFFRSAGCGHTIQAFPHSHRTTNRSQVRRSDLTLSKCFSSYYYYRRDKPTGVFCLLFIWDLTEVFFPLSGLFLRRRPLRMKTSTTTWRTW